MFNDARVWLSESVEDSVLLSKEVKRHGGALLQWTALDAMLHPNNARNVAFQTFAISDNAAESHTKKAMGYKWICLRSSWLRECFKKGQLIDPTRFTLKVDLQPRKKQSSPQISAQTSVSPLKVRKAGPSKSSTKAKSTGPKSTKTGASKAGRRSAQKPAKVSKPASAKKPAKPSEQQPASKRRKLSKPKKKAAKAPIRDNAFVEEVSHDDTEEPCEPEISSDSESSATSDNDGNKTRKTPTRKRREQRKSSEAGRKATRAMLKELNSEESPIAEVESVNQAKAIERLLTPKEARARKVVETVNKPEQAGSSREKALTPGTVETSRMTGALEVDAETETEVEESEEEVLPDPNVSLESVEDTGEKGKSPVGAKDDIEDPTPRKPRTVEVPGDLIKDPSADVEIVEIESGSEAGNIENTPPINNGTEGAAMGAAAVEASSSQRNSRKPRLEVEMSQLLFELSGDRALALRIFNNEAAAFKQYRKLRWMKKKDEILTAMMQLRSDDRPGAREQAQKLFFVLNRSEADCRQRHKFLKSAGAAS